MRLPYENIYIKRITRQEKIKEAIFIFITLSIVLLVIYGIVRYTEYAHAARMEEIMSGTLFNFELLENEGSLRIAGQSTRFVYSTNAKEHYRHKIEHLVDNKYLMIYMNKSEPNIYYTQIFQVNNLTITFGTVTKYATGEYINITKEQAARIINETN